MYLYVQSCLGWYLCLLLSSDLVPNCFRFGSHWVQPRRMVQGWSRFGSNLVQSCFNVGSDVVHIWFVVQIWFYILGSFGPDLVQIWFRFGFVHCWFRFGSGLVHWSYRGILHSTLVQSTILPIYRPTNLPRYQSTVVPPYQFDRPTNLTIDTSEFEHVYHSRVLTCVCIVHKYRYVLTLAHVYAYMGACTHVVQHAGLIVTHRHCATSTCSACLLQLAGCNACHN